MGAIRALDLDRLKANMTQSVVVDLRNICRPEDMEAAGFVYESVGRKPARAAPLWNRALPREVGA